MEVKSIKGILRVEASGIISYSDDEVSKFLLDLFPLKTILIGNGILRDGVWEIDFEVR